MKKRLLSAVLSAAMVLTSFVGVQAVEAQPINVLLNGELVEFADQAPANIDGRVLVPIRAVAEKMGGEVSWNEATQAVEIKKDDVNLALAINQPTINVNGEAKALDVAPQIIGDRTMLPIRAVVEELGATVGWDDSMKTVVIVDWEAYLAELETKAPNFYNFMKDSKVSYENYVSTANGNINFALDMKMPTYNVDGTVGAPEETKMNLSLNIVTDEATKDDVVSSNAAIKLNLADLQNFMDKMGVVAEDESSFDFTKLDEITLSIIVDGTTVYIKTNLVKKLSDAVGTDEMEAVAILFGESRWMKIDLSELMASMGVTEEEMSYVTGYFEMLSNTSADESVLDVILDFVKGFEYDMGSAEIVDMAFDMYGSIYSDEYFKYEKTGENAYTVSVNIDENTYADMMKKQYESMGMEMTDEEYKQFTDLMDITLAFDIVSDENSNTVCNVKMNFGSTIGDVAADEYVNIKFDMDIKSETKINAVTEAIAVPEESVDLLNLLKTAGLN